MIINSHVHMVRLGKEFSDELAEFYVQSNEGQAPAGTPASPGGSRTSAFPSSA